MLDSSTALMLLILLGVVVLVILVIAFMMNMKRSEEHNDQVLEDLDNSITELQSRMRNVENNRSTMTTGAISPREPEPLRQDHQFDGVTPPEEETPEPAQDARKAQETEPAVDDFWSSFQHVSANTGNQENKKETTTEKGLPNKQEEPAVDFGVFQRNADLARPAQEAAHQGGASPLDRQQGNRHGMGGMLNSFGFGKGSDTLVMERPQEAPQAPSYGMPQNPSTRQPNAPDISDLFRRSRSPSVLGQSRSQHPYEPVQSPSVLGQSRSQHPYESVPSPYEPGPQQATPYGNQPQQANPYGNQPQQANPYGNPMNPSVQYGGQPPVVNQGVGAVSPGQDPFQDIGLSLAEQLQQATQQMQEMAKQARDAVPQAEAAAKAAQQARIQYSSPTSVQAQQTQVQYSVPAPAVQPQRQEHQTAPTAPDYYANREGGIDKQGRVYSVEQLNAQIK